jgi:uncharacterized protein with NAD-binding domain and iron-sulfur cluster
MTSVAVLGGGVGGLSAAHELAERGFEVTVYEWREEFGGKARSLPVPDSGIGERDDLPAEHGFRFFPGFYRHVTDTMQRIPHGRGSVADHLVDAKRILLAQAEARNELIVPAELPSSINDLALLVQFVWDFSVRLRIPPWELALFMERIFTLLTSCDERRFDEWEQLSWWEFVGADKRSEKFKKFLADGLTRTLVAARAEEMSARTGGLILCQLLFDIMRVGGRVDRVLDAPTSEVWINPWVERLEQLGVTFRPGCKVTAIDCDGQAIAGCEVTAVDSDGQAIAGETTEFDGGTEQVVADYYVAALPVEQLRLLLTPALCAAEPRLEHLKHLVVRWMNGVMYYLDRDVALQRGHAIFIDSEWALTAISQAQFWPEVDLERRGNGKVDGILSVDVSEWLRASNHTGKKAVDSTEEEIGDEVWRQLVSHIDDGSLDEANVVRCFLDPAVQLPNPTKERINLEPLLVNTKGSWANRPPAVTSIPNLFLAADFVRTHTDLATMEAANEAARLAVNGILDATGSTASRCETWKPREPGVLAPLRALDRLAWRIERPVKSLVRLTPARALVPTGSFARGLLAAALRLR